MAGKTGTSQVRNISEAERRSGVIKNEDLPWERRDHALFVNFAPAEILKLPCAWLSNMAVVDLQPRPQLHVTSHFRRFTKGIRHLMPIPQKTEIGSPSSNAKYVKKCPI